MSRKYRKRARAEAEAETRRRITEALVQLHGTVGPARTTIRAVAERAGVQRATVYRHFPDEPSMLAACSAHWARENPFPDPTEWDGVPDPTRRLHTALACWYRFYDDNEAMLGNTTRDEPLVEALRPSMDTFRHHLERVADGLVGGLEVTKESRAAVRAVVGHALSFTTWKSLVCEQGLDGGEAAKIMARLAESVVERPV